MSTSTPSILSNPSTEYWCHQCDKIVDITTSSAFTDTLQCSECQSEFVEVVSPPASQRQPSTSASTTSQTQPQYYDTLFDNSTSNGSNGQTSQQQQQQTGASQGASASRTHPSISFTFTTYNMPLQQANINTNTNDPFSQMMGSLFTNLMGVPATPQRQQSATTPTAAATNDNSSNGAAAAAAGTGNEQTTNTSQPQQQGQAEAQANIPPFLQMLNSMFQNAPQQQQQGGVQFFTTVADGQQLPNFFQQIFAGMPFVMMPGSMGYRRDYHPPASQKVIDELRNITITDRHVENSLECAVCLEALKLGEICKQMPCHGHHIFHQQCLVPWLRQKNMCPMCREEVESSDLEYNEWKRQQAPAAASTSTSTPPQAPTQ